MKRAAMPVIMAAILLLTALLVQGAAAPTRQYVFRWAGSGLSPAEDSICGQLMPCDLDGDGADEFILVSSSGYRLLRWVSHGLGVVGKLGLNGYPIGMGDLSGQGGRYLFCERWSGGRWIITSYVLKGYSLVRKQVLALPDLAHVGPHLLLNHLTSVGSMGPSRKSIFVVLQMESQDADHFEGAYIIEISRNGLKAVARLERLKGGRGPMYYTFGLTPAFLGGGMGHGFLFYDQAAGRDSTIFWLGRIGPEYVMREVVPAYGIGCPGINTVSYGGNDWIIAGERDGGYPHDPKEDFIYSFRIRNGSADKYMKYPAAGMKEVYLANLQGGGAKSVIVLDSKGIYMLPLATLFSSPGKPITKI